jgi:hypothetical protein
MVAKRQGEIIEGTFRVDVSESAPKSD